MKNIIYSTVLLLMFIAGISCKKDNLITYQGQPDIYFDAAARLPLYTGDIVTDSTIVSFAFSTAKDSLTRIVIGVTGAKSAADREYSMSVNPASTAIAGKHYNALPSTFVIKANKLTDTLLLKMNRTPDMLTEQALLILDLKANANFVTNMQDKIVNTTTNKKMSFVTYKVYINDIIKKPSGWFDPYLGVFTRKKLELMIQVLGIEPAVLNNSPALAILGAYGKFMQRYLNDQKAAGQTVYETDGTEMSMGASVQ